MKQANLKKLESIMRSRFFISQSASIYGGTSGFFDMGPVLVGIKQNFITEWRKYFIMTDNLLEVDSSILVPYNVLKASGHVDKFCDILICDEVNDISYRADHYITSILETKNKTVEIEKDLKLVDCMTCQQIDKIITKYSIKSPDGNIFKPSTKFNLMFETSIGCKKGQSMFLRPETAQGQFVNFKKLYEYNNKKMPFGSASIGKAFRNEISPRSGLIRTREFEQAEIEYFVSPKNKKISKFEKIKDLVVPLCFNDKEEFMTLGRAISEKIIDNEILAYFMGKAFLFLQSIGINTKNLRFRQHKQDEMAHYAKDCWDVELFCSLGWIECVGIADRSAYDLTCHSNATNVDLTFSEPLNPPFTKIEWKPILNKKTWIKKLKGKYESFKNSLTNLTSDEIEKMLKSVQDTFYIDFRFESETYKIICEQVTSTIYENRVVPDVIEPSFGIGRILYVLLEHCFYTRECGRPVLRINSKLSHTKCVISCVVNDNRYTENINFLVTQFNDKGLNVEVNERSCSIGKKYASYDEIGIPYFITFDSKTFSDQKVTIRERDTMKQVRVNLKDVVLLVEDLVLKRCIWSDLKEKQ